jgi:hypothetical protein
MEQENYRKDNRLYGNPEPMFFDERGIGYTHDQEFSSIAYVVEQEFEKQIPYKIFME